MSLDVMLYDDDGNEIYSDNITHNLAKMADQAGIYKELWSPEEIGASKAKHIAFSIEKGLFDLVKRPSHYEKFNAENGWGKYENFVRFVSFYLEALGKYPDATLGVSR